MKEETQEIVICPKHGNKEYKIEPPHYCKNKIGEGCNCICTCHLEEKKCENCKNIKQGSVVLLKEDGETCRLCGSKVFNFSPSDKTWESFEYLLDGFFNDVLEAELRYIKGKGYGEESRDYFKKQLGHWEENFKSLLTSATIKAKEGERQFILNILDGIDEADRQMGNIGGTKAIRFALQSRIIDGNLEEPNNLH